VDSILNSIKKLLGIDSDYTPFDADLIILINSAFSSLSQIGVIDDAGFKIEDAYNTWDEILGEETLNLELIKTYIYLKVRQIFDPPTSSIAANAIKEELDELTFRIYMRGGGE